MRDDRTLTRIDSVSVRTYVDDVHTIAIIRLCMRIRVIRNSLTAICLFTE